MKKFALLALLVFVLSATAPVAFADTATTTDATSTPTFAHGGVSPLYFLHELGISTTIEIANTLWQDAKTQALIMSAWRFKVFGY